MMKLLSKENEPMMINRQNFRIGREMYWSSINERETFLEEELTPEPPEESEMTGFMRNYRRNPPLVLSNRQ